MNLFDQLVTEAIKNQPNLSPLRIVVEKELLHHNILKILSQHHLLKELTFIGGTCLRTCYGGIRLSEDLDFTGGKDFTRHSLSIMGTLLIESLQEKYGLSVKVSEPIKDLKNVDTWKIKVDTRPQQRNIPTQRINIDICAVPSYEKRPMLLMNPYGVDMGTSGLIIQAQSREEIYADKLLAFAFRPNRIKYRDLWDIAWLHQQGLKPRFKLIPNKLHDRDCTIHQFLTLFDERNNILKNDKKVSIEFKKEMDRFLSAEHVNQIMRNNDFLEFITYLMGDLAAQLRFAQDNTWGFI